MGTSYSSLLPRTTKCEPEGTVPPPKIAHIESADEKFWRKASAGRSNKIDVLHEVFCI